MTTVNSKVNNELWEIRKGRWTILGTSDLSAFLETLPPNMMKDQKSLLELWTRISKDVYGPRLLPVEISHRIDDENQIWEFIKGRLRVPWFYAGPNTIICSHGFVKTGQKTPESEKEKARKLKKQLSDTSTSGSSRKKPTRRK